MPVRARKEGSTVAPPDDETTTRFTTAGAAADHRDARAEHAPPRQDRGFADVDPSATTREQQRVYGEPVVTGPKPRASLLATLGLILAVASALLVLSGPLLGYGIGVAALALILSLAGLRATRRRHVAGKTDALIGTVVSLAAIAVGVLALTGSLNWLGTDMQPVNSVRDWLDAQVVDRF
jgi:hypothetical protein